MKVKAKGHLAAIEFECGNVSSMNQRLLMELDKLPDEIEGVKVMDWTSLHIEVTK